MVIAVEGVAVHNAAKWWCSAGASHFGSLPDAMCVEGVNHQFVLRYGLEKLLFESLQGLWGAFCHLWGSVASFLGENVGMLCDYVFCWSRTCVCCLRADISNFFLLCSELVLLYFSECVSVAHSFVVGSHGCVCCFRFAAAWFCHFSPRCNLKLPFRVLLLCFAQLGVIRNSFLTLSRGSCFTRYSLA